MADEELVVFYAWQSDSLPRDNRNFIESALEQAFKSLHRTGKVQSSPRLDKDTKDIPGTPDIANTIFDKIRAADVFVADVSFVGIITSGGKKDKLVPNPNVMVELGYALSELGWERIALVLNTTTGSQNDLPFDLRNRRWPVAYQLFLGSDETTRSAEKKKLAKQFEDAIAAITKLPPRQKKGTIPQRLDTLETMVASLSGSLAQYTTMAHLVSGLQKVSPAADNDASDPKSKCKGQLDALIKRLETGKFEKVANQQGTLAMAICPTSAPSPIPLFEGNNERTLTSGLVPLDVSSWNHRTYGERLVTYSGTRESMEAATEITLEGYINAASSSAVSLSPDFYRFSAQKATVDQIGIPSVAYEKRIIEAVFNYVKVLKALGTQGPWYVGLAIINVKKSFLYVDQRYAFGGQTFEGDSIVPPIVEISADTGLENPQAIARTLRPAFDYIWREHGYPRSFNYVPSGDWIGS